MGFINQLITGGHHLVEIIQKFQATNQPFTFANRSQVTGIHLRFPLDQQLHHIRMAVVRGDPKSGFHLIPCRISKESRGNDDGDLMVI